MKLVKTVLDLLKEPNLLYINIRETDNLTLQITKYSADKIHHLRIEFMYLKAENCDEILENLKVLEKINFRKLPACIFYGQEYFVIIKLSPLAYRYLCPTLDFQLYPKWRINIELYFNNESGIMQNYLKCFHYIPQLKEDFFNKYVVFKRNSSYDIQQALEQDIESTLSEEDRLRIKLME